LLVPDGVAPAAGLLLASRGLRGLADGCISLLLPVYLAALGMSVLDVGALGTLTLFGSAAATLAVGVWGHRVPALRLMTGAAIAMAATGLGFAVFSDFWPLAVVAFVGTLNPSSGDVSVFLPLEHARLANAAPTSDVRTRLFARYSLVGSLSGAVGALGAAFPVWFATRTGTSALLALKAAFVVYAAIGLVVAMLYRQLHLRAQEAATGGDAGLATQARALGPSRGVVMRIAALFCIDSFAGGLLVNSMMAVWLFRRFGLSVADAGAFFFVTGLLTTASLMAAPAVARRFGLLNTMVFTHIPANLCLAAAALVPTLPLAMALLLVRASLQAMDVPTRNAFVMALVTPGERAAAASVVAVPRSLAAALGPLIGGAVFTAGALAAPLVACGLLKTGYDIAMLLMFRRHRVD
jgi:predicted MFS family arabinose efflux permease